MGEVKENAFVKVKGLPARGAEEVQIEKRREVVYSTVCHERILFVNN